MATRGRMSKREFDDAWKALPESDRRFYCALILLMDVVGDDSLRYDEPSTSRQRSLRKLDRNALFSVIAECLYLLLGAPMLERIKKGHREREARKKKRVAAAKKRSPAAKKKSRSKKSAPKRRKRKGPSQ